MSKFYSPPLTILSWIHTKTMGNKMHSFITRLCSECLLGILCLIYGDMLSYHCFGNAPFANVMAVFCIELCVQASRGRCILSKHNFCYALTYSNVTSCDI